MIDPTHPEYAAVRAVGIDVDLRAQELMVLMARARLAEAGGERGQRRAAARKLAELDAVLAEMHGNAQGASLFDAIMAEAPLPPQPPRGAGDSWGSGGSGEQRTLAALDPDTVVAKAEAAGKPISEVIRALRGLSGARTAPGANKKKGKEARDGKKRQRRLEASPRQVLVTAE